MITLIQPLAVGNALRLFIAPPAGAERWRVLRRTSDSFTGPDDSGAYLIHEGTDEVLLDSTALVNGTEYFYRAWWWDGVQWTDGGVLAGTPNPGLQDESVDALVVLRERLDAGLEVEVAAGRLRHDREKIKCYNAPPRLDTVVLPVVTVQLSQDAPAEQFLGEEMAPDEHVDAGYLEFDGWFSRVQIEVVGWSFNPDERIQLRQALKRIIIGNLPVFAHAGLLLIQFSQQDNEDYQSFNAPIYQTWGTFSCLVPSMVAGEIGEISDVITELTWG